MRALRFEFATAGRILFGAGASKDVPSAAKSMGSKPLLVTGKSADRWSGFRDSLVREVGPILLFSVPGEPTTDLVKTGAMQACEHGCDVVIAIGGGSVIDAGKAIAALMTNTPDPLDYLEVIGKGRPLTNPSAPCIAIPTTAGTGAEVTRNSVLASPEHRVKASLRSPYMLPRLAVVDPELTGDLPREVTASTGLDALTQLIEAYVSVKANPITDGFCEQGIPLVARSLRRAYSNPDAQSRADMSLASLLSGLALANAGLGAVHGFAAPLGGMFDAPHGALCAAVLPHATRVNVEVIRGRDASGEALRRYGTVARLLTGRDDASVDDAVAYLTALVRDLSVPPLRAYGVGESHVADLVAKAQNANSMKGNPISLRTSEVEEILRSAM